MCIFLKFLNVWINFRFLHTADVEKYEISPLLACVWCDKCQHMQMQCYFVMKSVCWNFTHFCREICIVVNLGTLCVKKKISKNCISGEKITNMRSAPFWQCQYFHWNCYSNPSFTDTKRFFNATDTDTEILICLSFKHRHQHQHQL